MNDKNDNVGSGLDINRRMLCDEGLLELDVNLSLCSRCFYDGASRSLVLQAEDAHGQVRNVCVSADDPSHIRWDALYDETGQLVHRSNYTYGENGMVDIIDDAGNKSFLAESSLQYQMQLYIEIAKAYREKFGETIPELPAVLAEVSQIGKTSANAFAANAEMLMQQGYRAIGRRHGRVLNAFYDWEKNEIVLQAESENNGVLNIHVDYDTPEHIRRIVEYGTDGEAITKDMKVNYYPNFQWAMKVYFGDLDNSPDLIDIKTFRTVMASFTEAAREYRDAINTQRLLTIELQDPDGMRPERNGADEVIEQLQGLGYDDFRAIDPVNGLTCAANRNGYLAVLQPGEADGYMVTFFKGGQVEERDFFTAEGERYRMVMFDKEQRTGWKSSQYAIERGETVGEPQIEKMSDVAVARMTGLLLRHLRFYQRQLPTGHPAYSEAKIAVGG